MTQSANSQSSIQIGKKTFFTALLILAGLIITVGILTLIIPTGTYQRQIIDGRETIIQGSFHLTQMVQVDMEATAPITRCRLRIFTDRRLDGVRTVLI